MKDYCEMMIATAALLAEHQLFASGEIILSAGGGAWFDVVAACFSAAQLPLPVTPLIRSGAYMAHDSGLYARIAPLRSRVQRTISAPHWRSGAACYRVRSRGWPLSISAGAMCRSIRICPIRCGFVRRTAAHRARLRIAHHRRQRSARLFAVTGGRSAATGRLDWLRHFPSLYRI